MFLLWNKLGTLIITLSYIIKILILLPRSIAGRTRLNTRTVGKLISLGFFLLRLVKMEYECIKKPTTISSICRGSVGAIQNIKGNTFVGSPILISETLAIRNQVKQWFV